MIDYSIRLIPCLDAKDFIHTHHYSQGSHYRPAPNYGLFDGENLIGVLMIATPCSERVRASVFGADYKTHVSELHRLAILDNTPKNTESWFISRCLKMLRQDKPELWCLVSFADTTVGHKGTIYRASNAIYAGMTQPQTFYEDETGRLRHPRQCGVNISKADALAKGWTPVKRQAKHRFLFILGNRKEKRERTKKVILGGIL
jgi:hypothetical protein